MTILKQKPGYKLWLDDTKLYERKNRKTREVIGIAKAMLLAIYGARGVGVKENGKILYC